MALLTVLLAVLLRAYHLQIFQPIVPLVAVLVVNHLPPAEPTPKMFLHHRAMGQDVSSIDSFE
jgi:hypothetical protein